MKGAVDGVKQVGGDTVGATKTAILAAFKAAKEVGGDAANAVTKSLEKSFEGAKDILDEIKK
ncbi:MAG: hypothetical protein OEV30_04310 [Ignavibacteria bacterium]|nr:hypothetical protein [Ignavibacteria bacterium]